VAQVVAPGDKCEALSSNPSTAKKKSGGERGRKEREREKERKRKERRKGRGGEGRRKKERKERIISLKRPRYLEIIPQVTKEKIKTQKG
jgi:hypothetical protein